VSAVTSTPVSSLVGGGVMLRSNGVGDVHAVDAPTHGLFISDTRVLSAWQLRVDGHDLQSGGADEKPGNRTVALIPRTGRNETADLFLIRAQSVDTIGLSESIRVRNVGSRPTGCTVSLDIAADFIDQFAIRSDGRRFDLSAGVRSQSTEPGGVRFEYRHERDGVVFESGVSIVATSATPAQFSTASPGAIPASTLTWAVQLEPGEETVLDLRVAPSHDTSLMVPAALGPDASAVHGLRDTAMADFEALLMPVPGEPNLIIPAAGVPWFLTLFGRDSLISSMLVGDERPGLLADVVRALARTQGTTDNPRRVEEAGKILHELRRSELSMLDYIPYGRYYGSADSTPLFLMAVARLTDPELLRELQPTVRAAVAWLRGPGGLDHTGFIRYTPDPNGLLHQGWKDSFDAISFADGRLAEGTIALSEVQGYAWRALVDTAGLARQHWDDPAWADELEDAAAALRSRFRDHFWLDEQDFPAIALDGAGTAVDSISSNAGHLLWSGILSPTEARRVTDRLLQPDMFSGWGLRTLSSTAALYHPLSYHNGSVWPHDTMLAALGMLDYGFRDEAAVIAQGVARAAAYFDHHLPELFGGFSTHDFPQPVRYAHAAAPQAWAAAAAVAAARILRSTDGQEGPQVD
jgi:glycogen debranching enzyme